MKMREYVDSIQGKGSWDHIHECIAKGEMFGWSLPPVYVDGHEVHIFPGSNQEILLEDVQSAIKKVLATLNTEKID